MHVVDRASSPDLFPDWNIDGLTSRAATRSSQMSLPLPNPRGFPAPGERIFNPLKAWTKSRWGPPPPPSKQRRITREFKEDILANCRRVAPAINSHDPDAASSLHEDADDEQCEAASGSLTPPTPMPRRAGADPAMFYQRRQPAAKAKASSCDQPRKKPRLARRNRTWMTRLRRRHGNDGC